MLKYKHSGVEVSQLDSTAKKSLNNEVCEQVLAVIFINNYNRRIYYEIVNTLEKNYLMGKDNYPRDISTSQKLLVNYKHMEKSSGSTSDGSNLRLTEDQVSRRTNQVSCVFDAGYRDTNSPRIHSSKRKLTNIIQMKK